MRELRVSELQQRRPPRFSGRHAAVDVVVGLDLNMTAKLFRELAVALGPGAKEAKDSRHAGFPRHTSLLARRVHDQGDGAAQLLPSRRFLPQMFAACSR